MCAKVLPPILIILFLRTTIKSRQRTRRSTPIVAMEMLFVEEKGEIIIPLLAATPGEVVACATGTIVGAGVGVAVGVGTTVALGAKVEEDLTAAGA